MESSNPNVFVFVLMPFINKYSDIYNVGIKSACNEVGAYCERVDEQIFTERILDRIYKQITKADIIVAEMTGRNLNVFYEVGFAHALKKQVILLTKNINDIPFDLREYPHIIYGGSISTLKSQLKTKIHWYIEKRLKRIALICSTTDEIERSKKTDRLKIFYYNLIKEIERLPYGFNTCGAEPLREAFFKYYCEKIYNASKPKIQAINKKVCWYWHKGATVGLDFEPSFYESKETTDKIDRLIQEVSNSDIIVAFTGRTGVSYQIEQLFNFHTQQKQSINLKQKQLLLLGWFGGTVKEFIDKNQNSIGWLLKEYQEINLTDERTEWVKGDNPVKLAKILVRVVRWLLDKNSNN